MNLSKLRTFLAKWWHFWAMRYYRLKSVSPKGRIIEHPFGKCIRHAMAYQYIDPKGMTKWSKECVKKTFPDWEDVQ